MNILIKINKDGLISHGEFLAENFYEEQSQHIKISNGNCPQCFCSVDLNIFIKKLWDDSGVKNEVSEDSLAVEIKPDPELFQEDLITLPSASPTRFDELNDNVYDDSKRLSPASDDSRYSSDEEKSKKLSALKGEKHKMPSCKICGKSFSCLSSLKKHMKLVKHKSLEQKSETQEDFYTCESCSKVFSLASSLKKHVKLKHLLNPESNSTVSNLTKDDFTCDLCLQTFVKRKDILEHMQSIHMKRSSDRFICTNCDPPKKYLTLKAFRDHQRRKHSDEIEVASEEYQCPKCLKPFISSATRNSHYGICIDSKTPLCYICQKSFIDMKAVVKHIEIVHKRKKCYVCHVCGLGFNYSYQLKCHVEAHNYSDPRPFKCEICGKGFKNKDYIENHIMYCHRPVEEYKFVCEHCSRRFPTLNRLKNHVENVHTTTFYDCKLCSKKLKSKTSLQEHIEAMHTRPEDQKRYPCTFCNYVTHNKKYLPLHMLQHTDEKDKFRCSVCNKTFVTKHLLDRHSMIHSDKRDHGCSVCGKRFRHAADLTSHTRLHTGEKPFRCQVCDQRFSDRGCYRSHLVGHERHLNITLDKSTRMKPIFIDRKTKNSENVIN